MSNKKNFITTGVLVDPVGRDQYGAEIVVENGKISRITRRPDITYPYILPGFIDAHVHVESSMLIPSRFAQMALKHGTVGVVTDPHEIANVAGIAGIEFMIENGRQVPLEFFFGAPSCVPASALEKSGAYISGEDVEQLLQRPDIWYLSEMMNFPGVVNDDPEVWHKLRSARKYNKPVDGHAPGLMGEALEKYAKAGISTDHECSTLEEALAKIRLGMKILIREGSAAKNFDNLIALLTDHSDRIMFCTDDCHPDFLLKGHINKLASRAIKAGHDLYDVLRVACINPVNHYNLPVGLLNEGDRADFVVVEDLRDFHVISTFVDGVAVFENKRLNFTVPSPSQPEFPFRRSYASGQLKVMATSDRLNVIKAIEGELVTEWEVEECSRGSEVKANVEKDLLKIVLLDRYSESAPVVGFIRGFGLQRGALACSVAHDSHHIVAVGCDDTSIDLALKWVVDQKGGMCISAEDSVEGIALPFFGLMTDEPGEQVAGQYHKMGVKAQDQGSVLSSPFMTLSFMALTVIPSLKINHNGLFDVDAFESVSLFAP